MFQHDAGLQRAGFAPKYPQKSKISHVQGGKPQCFINRWLRQGEKLRILGRGSSSARGHHPQLILGAFFGQNEVTVEEKSLLKGGRGFNLELCKEMNLQIIENLEMKC